jgi:hypothetical protein
LIEWPRVWAAQLEFLWTQPGLHENHVEESRRKLHVPPVDHSKPQASVEIDEESVSVDTVEV